MSDSINILKAGFMDEGGGGGDPIPFNFEDVRAMAAKLLRVANDQAQRKLMAAEEQAQQIETAAYQEGHDKGYGEGYPKGETEGRAAGDTAAREAFAAATETVTSNLTAMLSELETRKVELQAQAEADLLQLAMAIARRIVRHELSLRPDSILPTVNEAISLANDRSDLIVRVNPDDLTPIEQELPALRQAFTDLGKVHLEADPEMVRGGVCVVSNDGEVDMRLEEQLRAIEQALIGEDVSPEGE